ncbi:MAG: M2 family metallopeptidase, partial [Woeseia sp.]
MKTRLILLALILAGCEVDVSMRPGNGETADVFVARINDELSELNRETGAAEWVRATYITEDTAILNSLATERYTEWHSRSVAESRKYEGQDLLPETERSLKLLKLGVAAPAPADAAKRRELAELITELEGMYGAGKYCPDDGRDCMTLPQLSDVMQQSRDYDELLDAWQGWRTISPPMRDKYRRYTELANEGAAELGYEDLGDKWKSAYDMTPVEFEQETLRLWQQVRPLYDELHCHVRAGLVEQYGA